MKFPMSPRPFGHVELSAADARAMEQFADAFVDEALTHYESFLLRDNGVVHPSQWKLVKKKKGVAVYRQRALPTGPAITSSGSYSNHSGSANSSSGTGGGDSLQVMLGCGAAPGQLDDLMYGVLSASRESMALRSAYVGDNAVDCSVLASVVEPSEKDAVRSVQVKWSVNACPKAVRRLVRPRDFVYLEATGMAQLPTTGERVGYHVLHSIEVPGVHELHAHGLVRGNLSLFQVFRQRVGGDGGSDGDGEVDMFVRGFIDLKGDMRASVAAYATADSMLAIASNMKCARMKKLAWAYRHRPRATVCDDQADAPRDCGVCRRSFLSVSMMMRRGVRLRPSKACSVCRASVCTSCRETHRLLFADTATHRVASKRVCFCSRCEAESLRLRGADLAIDELARDGKHEYPDTMTSSSRSLSLSLSLGSSPSERAETEAESEFGADDDSLHDGASEAGSTRRRPLPSELGEQAAVV